MDTKQVKDISLNYKIIWWILIFGVIVFSYTLIFFIYEISDVITDKTGTLLAIFFIVMSFSCLLVSLYGLIYSIITEFTLYLSSFTLKIIQICLHLFSILMILCLIAGILTLTSFLLVNGIFPFFDLEIFVILAIISLSLSILFFVIRIYNAKRKYKKLNLNPTLLNSFLLDKIDLAFFMQKHNPLKNKNSTSNLTIHCGDSIFNFYKSSDKNLYRKYNNTFFSKLNKLIRAWFTPLNIFLLSSFISILATIIAYIILNPTKSHLAQIAALLFIFVFFLILLSLAYNNFYSTKNFQVTSEDDETYLKNEIEKIEINVVNNSLVLRDKNVVFIMGIVRKILLYLGEESNDFVFKLTTNKDLKIMKYNEAIFLHLRLEDKKLFVLCEKKN